MTMICEWCFFLFLVVTTKAIEYAEHDAIQHRPASATTPRQLLSTPEHSMGSIAPYFQWDTSLWPQRNIDFNVTLNIPAFEEALQLASNQTCDLGMTATLYDYQNPSLEYHQTVGSMYYDTETTHQTGWTADTTFALYSNSKIFATVLYMKSVVEEGLGYLDEPLHQTFAYLNKTSIAGQITARQILSHRSGLPSYDRNDDQDPFYSCINNETTTLDECLQDHLLVDELMMENPGTTVRYSNDPFYIVASLIVQKTDYDTIDEALQALIVKPLKMSNATTYECPLVGSTATKPHVSWGICSTGRDVPKLIRELLFYNRTTLLSADSIRQILSFQVGTSQNADRPLAFGVPLNNCLSRSYNDPDTTPANALIGYGLGTMITAGVKGIHFVHAATIGGYWVIAPHRYALYFAFSAEAAFTRYYAWMAWIVDRLERASTVMIKNSWENETSWYEMTPCVDGMFFDTDLLEQATAPVPCPAGFGSPYPAAAPDAEAMSNAPSTTPSFYLSDIEWKKPIRSSSAPSWNDSWSLHAIALYPLCLLLRNWW